MGRIQSCTQKGHSCGRKVVSFYRIWGRKLNRIWHRGAQTILQQLPGWEIWTLRDAPKIIRLRESKLVYVQKYRRRCIVCGKKKKAGTSTVCDAGQAYEQTMVKYAVISLIWACAWVTLNTSFTTVTINREYPGSSRLGGNLVNYLDLNSAFVILSSVFRGNHSVCICCAKYCVCPSR